MKKKLKKSFLELKKHMITKNQIIGLLIFITVGQITATILWLCINRGFYLHFLLGAIISYVLIGQLIRHKLK
jgi:hypothetical protein